MAFDFFSDADCSSSLQPQASRPFSMLRPPAGDTLRASAMSPELTHPP